MGKTMLSLSRSLDSLSPLSSKARQKKKRGKGMKKTAFLVDFALFVLPRLSRAFLLLGH